MAMIKLYDLGATRLFGKILAKELASATLKTVFLQGPLGCGKTALVSAIVANMPGGALAETSSPSFTICNEYPTSPPILHCDLYRCRGGMPEEISDAIATGSHLLFMEWAAYMPTVDCPKEYLDISFNMVNDFRLLALHAKGEVATAMVSSIEAQWQGVNPPAMD